MGLTLQQPVRTAEDIRALIRACSPLPTAQTEDVIRRRFQALPRRLVAALRLWPLDTAQVLDIGCSWGHCLVHFGPGSVGIDNVPEHVEFCRSLGLDARLGDVEDGLSGLEDASFDAVWVSDVLEHLDAPRLLLRRVAPKLRPGGLLVLYLSVLPRSRWARVLFRSRGFFDADVHHYQFTLETARYLVERSGYTVVEVLPHGVPRALVGLAPTVFVAARPDPFVEERVRAAELRNKPPD